MVDHVADSRLDLVLTVQGSVLHTNRSMCGRHRVNMGKVYGAFVQYLILSLFAAFALQLRVDMAVMAAIRSRMPCISTSSVHSVAIEHVFQTRRKGASALTENRAPCDPSQRLMTVTATQGRPWTSLTPSVRNPVTSLLTRRRCRSHCSWDLRRRRVSKDVTGFETKRAGKVQTRPWDLPATLEALAKLFLATNGRSAVDQTGAKKRPH